MPVFSNEEYADILMCYGLCQGNSRAARAEYVQRYPGRRVPDVSVFDGAYRRLRETGSVQRRNTDMGRPRVYDVNVEDEIQRCFQEDPTTSTRVVAQQLGVSQWKVWFTMHTAGNYPYHYTPVHVIEEGDPIRRMDFSRFMLNADAEDPDFLKRILWTDESKFDKDGISNYHNAHYWAPKTLRNPNKKRVKGSQRRFSVNVWMGIINNHLIGPVFLPQNLNGERYQTFLTTELHDLLDDLPLALIRDMWYQHDGCPAHYFRGVRDWLNENFPDRWIGRGGPLPWPARCPDLTPMDYYLWGHMKSIVYQDGHPVANVDILKQRIIDASEKMRRQLTTRAVKNELRTRLRNCIRNMGGHVEHEL